MTNSKVLFKELISSITLNESIDEISAVVYLFMEKRLGVSRTDVLLEKRIDIDTHVKTQIKDFVEQINTRKPVQYILGEAEFYGRPFKVSPDVLIPRPETEALVKEVLAFCMHNKKARILDIGTGSGCIPITIALEAPGAKLFATDVSPAALAIATENAETLHVQVEFYYGNILKEEIQQGDLDVVVSNPPYVTQRDKQSMKENVLGYEPHLALFVPDDDPLLFYRSILLKSKSKLKHGGMIAVEINERFGKEVASLISEYGYTSVEIVKDVFEKDRIVKGTNP